MKPTGHDPAAGPPDFEAFVRRVHALPEHPDRSLRDLFQPGEPLFVARAPGRLDLMGGIADYSGSLVLQLPIREAAFAAVQRTAEPFLRIVSPSTLNASGAPSGDAPPGDATPVDVPPAGVPPAGVPPADVPPGRSHAFEMPLNALFGDGPTGHEPATYDAAREYFASRPADHWAAYAAGAFLVLARERAARFSGGASILISSSVPEGKGVSSSAAVEVAVMQAVAAAFDVPLDPRELAVLCQVVENRVVGAPCGIMDQMTSACGREGRLLELLCQPAEILGMVPLPPEIAVWGLDSGVRHHVSGASYGSVRVGAFMGYRILAAARGLPARLRPGASGTMTVQDPAWRGYLANTTPSEFETSFRRLLPETIAGAEFLERYGGTTDPVTRVAPEQTYAVREPAAHPIYEHFRVRTFAELLQGPVTERQLELLGELMYQSHASYSACGLGSPATDRIVQLVREAGASQGLYGAKITGGGSGGTVAILGRADAGEAVRRVAAEMGQAAGYEPYLFEGSSPGAGDFGARVVFR